MAVDRVQIQDVLASQIPSYIRDDFPLLVSFLEEYYVSQEVQGGTLDLIENLDQYVKVDELAAIKTETKLGADLGIVGNTIKLSSDTNFTYKFPDYNGIIQIDDEIIKYGNKTATTFENCRRGFSGITEYTNTLIPDKQIFKTSLAAEHKKGAIVKNLSVLFLQEFFNKLKTQIAPGFESRTLATGLDQRNFVKASDSFYKAKGTDDSFKILFRAIYGVDVEILKPNNQLIRSSDADYKVSEDYVIEAYVGDPLKVKNLTIYQDSTGARGTCTKVEKIHVEGDFYQISIDTGYQRDINAKGTIVGKFEPNPKTKLLNAVGAGATFFDVDSTIDFPSSGRLSVKDSFGNENILSYSDKNLTQFLGVTTTTSNFDKAIDVRKFDYTYANIGVGTESQVRFRLLSALKGVEYIDKNFGLSKGDRISLKTLGVDDSKNDWFYNIKFKLGVAGITLINGSNNIYQIDCNEDHHLKTGYKLVLTNIDISTNFDCEVTSINSSKSINVELDNVIPTATLSQKFSIENQLLRGNSTKLSVGNFNANVQNVYLKEDKYLLASESIPNYDDEIRCDDRIISFTGAANFDIITLSSSGDHGFFNGDAIYYSGNTITTIIPSGDGGSDIVDITTSKFTNVDEGVYFVQRIDAFSIRLAKSKADLMNKNYITPAGSVTNNKFTYYPFYQKNLEGQKIFREIDEPTREAGTFTTKPGRTGVLINGVEIDNYKSSDVIFYGEIDSFEVTSGGNDYDIINPPVLEITDEFGSGASGTISVNGSLSELNIINTGFDYIDTPTVKISGGNPTRDAQAFVNTIKTDHVISFQAGIELNNLDGGVDIANDIIGFTTFHNLRTIEQVKYISKRNPVVGLTTDAVYFSKVVDGTKIQLFGSFDDADAGINTISLTGLGNGLQSIATIEKKKVVSSINVADPGSGYKNQERSITSAGISTASNIFTIKNHGYNTNDIICYEEKTTPIGGLSINTEYFVGKIDDDKFKLYEVGSGSLDRRYYIDNNIVLNITGEGDGCFNYKPIIVTIEGRVGVDTNFGQNINAIVQPVFRGQITSANVSESGVGYGSSEIFNFNRKPNIILKSGSDAQLTPVVENGSIKQVIVNRGGSGYNSPPHLSVTIGSFCKLTPIIENGVIKSVVVVAGGINYRSDSQIIVLPSGTEGSISANINQWTINKFEQKLNKLTDDDCIIAEGSLSNSLQLAHLYAPRNLRSALYGRKSNGEIQYQHPDLKLLNGQEIKSKYHSPIIGWAYDGCPIYGPYGYDRADGGNVRRMLSGYVASAKSNRPPLNLYPLGFFVEDYDFLGTGDLNRNNGRFCVTPDYPKGTFCYFTTINDASEGSGPFKNLKKPVFPYLIGDGFQHKPNTFNFQKISNHVDYNLVENNWRRITTPYKINTLFGGYDYIFNSNKEKEQVIEVTGVSQGSVDSVGIFTGGDNYKVNDRIEFKGDTFGKAARGAVDVLKGKLVNNVDIKTTLFSNIEFINVGRSDRFVGIMTIPHNIVDNTLLRIGGLSKYFDGFDGRYNVGVNSGSYVLLENIDTAVNTGIVTFFTVGGAFQYPFIRPNDIITIESERVKVLNSDPLNNRIRVLREQDGTTGAAHVGNLPLLQDSRQININVGTLKTTQLSRSNTEFYFEPSESVGIGTSTTEGIVGAGLTLFFKNPGAGITNIFAPEQTIYIPGHNLKINDILTYRPNGDTLRVWNGKAGSPHLEALDSFSELFVAPVSDDFIGLATNKVGVGSTADIYPYIEINDPTVGLLFFTDLGTGVFHGLKTNFDDVIFGQARRTQVNVATATTHGMFVNDKIKFNLNPKNEDIITVKYNNFNRRIVFNPQDFIASDVDVTSNSIGIATGTFKTGDRVIHQSITPSGGLVDEKMYYVYLDTETSIKLVDEKFELSKISPNFIDITSAGIGTLSKINPSVDAVTNLKFDLSDSSLAFVSNSIQYPAFKMEIFTDSLFVNQYLTTGEDQDFNVKTSGVVGVDGELTLDIKDIPFALYYKFSSQNESFITEEKKLVTDENVFSYNTIYKSLSILDGTYSLVGVGSTTFVFDLDNSSAIVSYDRTTADADYTTTSVNAQGPIEHINLIDNNYGYTKIPGVSSIKTALGQGAILYAESESIGEIRNQKFVSNNIGWNYPTDKTLKPTANLPEIVEINSLASFERIGISSSGVDYLVAPQLIVRDGVTDEIVDCVISYELGDPEVTITKNTRGMFPTSPRIIAINNSNGFEIGSINVTGKIVRLNLTNQFNSDDEYPFAIGGTVYVENVNIGVGTTGKGYNSSQYNNNLFGVVGVKTNAGGSGAYVEYTLKDFLSSTEIPGNVISLNSATVVPGNHLPIFETTLSSNDFLNDEIVTWDGKTGIVDNYDKDTGILKVKSQFDMPIGTIIEGNSSKTKGQVVRRWDFRGDIAIGAGTTINYGWQKETGMLNDSLQRLPDNDYYQRFSYSLKSPIPLSTWDNTVGALNHTAGFKKFSDLQVESTPNTKLTPIVDDTELSLLVNCIGEGSIHCWNDIDKARENIFSVNGKSASDTVFFDNIILTDYFESQGNRVLKVDDLSGEFNSNERSESFANISTFDPTVKFVKSLFLIQDTTFTDERGFQVSTAIVDDNISYMTTYAKLHTVSDLGFFEILAASDEFDFEFHPVKFTNNNYFVSSFAFAIDPSLVGAAGSSFGDVIEFETQEVNVAAGTTTNIVSVGTSYRSMKVLNLLITPGDEHHFAELNIVHNDTDCSIVEYNNIDETSSSNYLGGIGTYSAEISGVNVVLKFHPNSGIAVTSYSQVVSAVRGTSTTGFTSMSTARVGSGYVSIPSSGAPTEHVLSSYDTASIDEKYSASYQVITVEDTVNNHHEIFEFGVLNTLDIPGQQYVEFANVATNSGLGTVGVTATGNLINVVYTPNPNIAVEVKNFFVDLREISPTTTLSQIDYNDGIFKTQTGNYFGTKIDVRTSFNLLHKGDPIFARQFDGVTGINTLDGVVISPNHFFQTGEAVKYDVLGVSQRIPIKPTDFGGSVGIVNQLPTDLFAIKINDQAIGFATSPTAALAINPTQIEFDDVGVGNSHFITATKQNTKMLVSIDNNIQAPLSRTDITATLTDAIVFDTTFKTSGITTISANDIIKIDDEFMRVTSSVGTGITIFVERPILGSSIAPHSPGATIQKFVGNYNIIGNVINFVSAPSGNVPLSTSTSAPDERDYTDISTRSTFSGRVFTKRGISGGEDETYSSNFVFDDVSNQFTGVTSEFVLKNNGADVTGITSNTILLVNNIFQSQQGVQALEEGEYENFESVGVTTAQFTGSNIGTATGYDQNLGNLPVGGLIVSVGSSGGLGYQPLIGAGATAVVSVTGSIQSISIGNSGSGYRVGLVTNYLVGVQTYDGVVPIDTFIGEAVIVDGHVDSVNITNPGSDFLISNPPVVIIDEPLSYSGIPLEYSSSSPTGVGESATIDIKVGQGSSVIEFEINDFGFGFNKNEILTIPTGGTHGIPLDSTISFTEFQITIQDVYSDSFNAFSPGEFQILDRIDDGFDGIKRVFPLRLQGEPVSIVAASDSNIEVDQTLLVFINDVLQVPSESYTFEGGSQIIFNEAPKGPGSGVPEGDSSRIMFYKGAGQTDVVFRDVLETIKIGDSVQLSADVENGQTLSLNQNERVVTGITTVDAAKTNFYDGPGLAFDTTIERPVKWCKQTIDRKINGQFVSKDRVKYEPNIFPTSFITSSVGIGSTVVYVDSVRPLFDGNNETNDRAFQNKITITSQNIVEGATATATVSTAGTISALTITNAGQGYATAPEVSIAGTTTRAVGAATTTDGVVTALTVTDGGAGYTDAPLVLIEEPKLSQEIINVNSFTGDSGVVVGLGSTGTDADPQMFFDVYIPMNSIMRDASIVGTAITISTLNPGDYVVIQNTHVSIGITFAARDLDDTSTVSVATTFLDAVYQVATATTERVEVVHETGDVFPSGVGIMTEVRRIKCKVDTYGPGIAHTTSFDEGSSSWGKILFANRTNPQSFDFYGEDGVIGISTSGLVNRTESLKFKNYI